MLTRAVGTRRLRDGKDIWMVLKRSYRIRESKKAKRVILKMSPQMELEVVIPRGYDRGRIPGLVAAKSEWIEKTGRKLSARQPMDADRCFPPDRIHFRALDRVVVVACRPEPGSALSLRETGPDRLTVEGRLDHQDGLRLLLQDWLKYQGRLHLIPMLERLSAATGLSCRMVQIRNQKARWGSCSRRGAISLNAKILFFPWEYARYILLHELAHTRHLNHSPRFWSLVEELEPRYRELEDQLKDAWQYVPYWAMPVERLAGTD